VVGVNPLEQVVQVVAEEQAVHDASRVVQAMQELEVESV